jgi:hypothetical protein
MFSHHRSVKPLVPTSPIELVPDTAEQPVTLTAALVVLS